MKAEFNPVLRAQNKPTRKNAINAMCAYCVGCTESDLEAGFRQLIKDCSSYRCPLHNYRPYAEMGIEKVPYRAHERIGLVPAITLSEAGL